MAAKIVTKILTVLEKILEAGFENCEPSLFLV